MSIWDYFHVINGFSTPIGGVSWEHGVREKDIAKEVIVFLEDRRVLFIAGQLEVPEYCLRSVEKIRDFLTNELGKLPYKGSNEITLLEISIREMRSACEMFMTSFQRNTTKFDRISAWRINDNDEESVDFFMGLVNLRTSFALNINRISKEYGIEIKGQELKKIIDSYIT